MRGKISYKGEIILEYLKKYQGASTVAIARLLNKDYPIEFPKPLSARSSVRLYRKEIGDRSIKSIDTSSLVRTEKQKKNFMRRKFNLPNSDYEKIEPYKLPIGSNNLLFLSDIHFPYQDNKALDIALNYGIKEGVNAIYLNGDTLDMYKASRFTKDRRKRDLSDELEMCRDFFKLLKENFDCPIYYKIGNHEERWENFLKLQAPELLGISDFELDVILRFGQYGVNEIKGKQIAMAGKLALLHGHEFGYSVFSPVNAARGLYMRAKQSSIIGHHHQSSEHSEKSLNGEVVTTWSCGCLCGLNPDYMPFNKWNHGFAHIKFEKDGSYEVRNKRIINYKLV